MSRRSTISAAEPANPPGLARVLVERENAGIEGVWLAAEEPLEICVDGRPLAVTMRTPGDDVELAFGFLYTEGLIRGPGDLEGLEPEPDGEREEKGGDRIRVRLGEEARARRARRVLHEREFRATSACGLCGKASLEEIHQELPRIVPMDCSLELARTLPERMREEQTLFEATGGLHAAALFDASGRLLSLREDIGRHNAVDKIIGHELLADRLPLRGRILGVSGRAGFEIVQKALMAAIPVLVAVGAASSSADRLARESGMTLFSFVGRARGNRHGRFGSPSSSSPP